MPATAQPVTAVTFTDYPAGERSRLAAMYPWRQPPRLGGHILDCFRAEWPWIHFELPASPLPGTVSVGPEGVRRRRADGTWERLEMDSPGVFAPAADPG
jgi:hypothetical protein